MIVNSFGRYLSQTAHDHGTIPRPETRAADRMPGMGRYVPVEEPTEVPTEVLTDTISDREALLLTSCLEKVGLECLKFHFLYAERLARSRSRAGSVALPHPPTWQRRLVHGRV
jgi:hypothetical protein